ncbi:hypothetical protein V6N11_024493 [Hibiscus sabdariffa]|uniref:Uncharacterized protein n=1 Tax=Hibiscus sabdariffa TaxID=183260 RepID=A0ABR2QM96_9ROSI
MSHMFPLDACASREVGVSHTHCSLCLQATPHPDGLTTNTIQKIVASPTTGNEFVTNSNVSRFVERDVAVESIMGHESTSLSVVPDVTPERENNVEPNVDYEFSSPMVLPNVISSSHSPDTAANKDLTTYLSDKPAQSNEVNMTESSSSAHINSRSACVVSQPVQCVDVPRANTYSNAHSMITRNEVVHY